MRCVVIFRTYLNMYNIEYLSSNLHFPTFSSLCKILSLESNLTSFFDADGSRLEFDYKKFGLKTVIVSSHMHKNGSNTWLKSRKSLASERNNFSFQNSARYRNLLGYHLITGTLSNDYHFLFLKVCRGKFKNSSLRQKSKCIQWGTSIVSTCNVPCMRRGCLCSVEMLSETVFLRLAKSWRSNSPCY